MMKDETVVKLGRFACGTALLITHAVTGVNGTLILVAVVLLGIPYELVYLKGREVSSKSREQEN